MCFLSLFQFDFSHFSVHLFEDYQAYFYEKFKLGAVYILRKIFVMLIDICNILYTKNYVIYEQLTIIFLNFMNDSVKIFRL